MRRHAAGQSGQAEPAGAGRPPPPRAQVPPVSRPAERAGGWPSTPARRAVAELWNRGALVVADERFAPTYVNHGGLIPDLVHGPEAVKVGVALSRAAFPGLHVTIEALTAAGDEVVLRRRARRAPPRARAGGAAGSGPPAAGGAGTRSGTRSRLGALAGTTRSRFASDLIVGRWTSWDAASALRRLDLLTLGALAGCA